MIVNYELSATVCLILLVLIAQYSSGINRPIFFPFSRVNILLIQSRQYSSHSGASGMAVRGERAQARGVQVRGGETYRPLREKSPRGAYIPQRYEHVKCDYSYYY